MFRDSYQQPEEKFRGLFKFSIWPDLELWFVLPQLRILQHSRKSHWTTCYLHAEISISVKSEDKISTRARANFLRHFGHQFVQGTDPEPSSPRARNWVLITVEMGWRVGVGVCKASGEADGAGQHGCWTTGHLMPKNEDGPISHITQRQTQNESDVRTKF